MFTKNHNIVIVSSSARSHAQSAQSSGASIYTIDQFSDQDLSKEKHKKLNLESPEFFNELLEYFKFLDLPPTNTKIILGSGMEKWASNFSLLSEYGEVLGNTADNYEICNNHKVFFNLLDKLNIKHPKTLFSKPSTHEDWLQKFDYSNGGTHIQWLHKIKPQHQSGAYYQKYIDGVSVSDALPDEIELHVHNIIGEGVAAVWNSNLENWVGSLDAFYRNEGYWLINNLENDTLYFSWNIPEEETLLSRGTISKKEIEVPEHLSYNQSSMQAFYFIERFQLNNIALSEDDWIVAYNNGMIVGARRWNGLYTDIPVMGYDGMNYSIGYCNSGDIPTFKLYLDSTGEMIDLKVNSSIVPWTNLTINTVQLSQEVQIPNKFEISYPYPNPFNPSTSIAFGLPSSSEVDIKVYDIMGRQVATILSERLNEGYHKIDWNPANISTGIYFINIKANKNDFTYKVMFIK